MRGKIAGGMRDEEKIAGGMRDGGPHPLIQHNASAITSSTENRFSARASGKEVIVKRKFRNAMPLIFV